MTSTASLLSRWEILTPFKLGVSVHFLSIFKMHAFLGGCGDAASRLKFGSCETMTLPDLRLALSRGGDFSKQCQLSRVGVGDEAFAGGFGYGGLAGGVEFGFFEVFEDFFGAGDD